MFEMKEEYKLGLPHIDEQHARLFEIGEAAYQLLKDKYSIDKYDKIVALIHELSEYTVTHFKAEEEYMQSINYKRYLSHKVDHDDFINKVNSLDLDKIDQNQDEYIMEILNFIASWLVDHIIQKDLLITKTV
ncbi:bacteriohemerythrin [Clostridium thermarum]|uniref:bacteriohemerythrin n=1 Tax=Clostridium thermarum TaxID=1716543 RepID=UPI0011237B80|nr:hemerythrin family protein [Clostridium thermarum]